MTSVSYREAGVDLEAGTRAVELMKDAVRATYGPEVLLGIGAFGGLFDVSALKGMDRPVLVASTDGVGTKTKIATALDRFDTIGFDIVNHCINDILVQGARPLFFLDYIASSRIDPEKVASVVRSCAAACLAAGCALLGGETAEMPGVYAPGEFDLVGTIVGVVDRAQIIDGSSIVPGDQVIGLASAGLHTNGFSLARRVLQGWDLHATPPELGPAAGRGVAGAASLLPGRGTAPAAGRRDHQRPGPHHRRRADRQPAAHFARRRGLPPPPRHLAHSTALPAHPTRRPHRRSRDGPRVQSGPGHAGRRFGRRGQPR